MSRSRRSDLKAGLSLSLEALKQLTRQLGLAERLMERFFFFEAVVRKQRKSFGVEDLPLFLSDGQRVDLKSVEKMESEHIYKDGWQEIQYWLWISGKKIEAFSYNQILDEKFCFLDSELMSDPAILKVAREKKHTFKYNFDNRFIKVNGKDRQISLYRELDTHKWYLDTGAEIDPSIEFVTVVGARVHISLARHPLDFDHFIELDGERIQVYTYSQIKGAELYQELLQTLKEQPIQDLHETEAS